MKWLLLVVVAFSLITIFELQKEYKKNNVSKNAFAVMMALEGLAAIISFALFLYMQAC